MCSHYQGAKDLDRLKAEFGLGAFDSILDLDVWPLYQGYYVARDQDQAPSEFAREGRIGQFGLLPHWAKDVKFGRQTYNARSETAPAKPAFRDAWKRGQRCIVPAEAIYEPSWETGKAVPWRISHADGRMLGIAGLWSEWRDAGGTRHESFTMLTVNADGHPLMQRFHRPTDEKRMVVMLDPKDYDRWLDCPVERMMTMMTRFPAEELVSEPAPAPARNKKEQPAAVIEDDQQNLL
ncbi:MAG: SOS response-associated peptidase [Rubrivivax sp.]|nr:MAG: SOS response-associated peptidase [Rubrivivax sp.]